MKIIWTPELVQRSGCQIDKYEYLSSGGSQRLKKTLFLQFFRFRSKFLYDFHSSANKRQLNKLHFLAPIHPIPSLARSLSFEVFFQSDFVQVLDEVRNLIWIFTMNTRKSNRRHNEIMKKGRYFTCGHTFFDMKFAHNDHM